MELLRHNIKEIHCVEKGIDEDGDDCLFVEMTVECCGAIDKIKTWCPNETALEYLKQQGYYMA